MISHGLILSGFTSVTGKIKKPLSSVLNENDYDQAINKIDRKHEYKAASVDKKKR